MTSRNSAIASRSAFHGLRVDEGELSADDVPDHASATTEGGETDISPASTAKLSRAAQKRAAKAARHQDKTGQNGTGVQTNDLDRPGMATTSPPIVIKDSVEMYVPSESVNSQMREPILQSNDGLGSAEQSRHSTLGEARNSDAPPGQLFHTSESYTSLASKNIGLSDVTDIERQTKEHFVVSQAASVSRSLEDEKLQKRQKFFVRTLWTFIMISGFLLCLTMGHSFMILLVMVCQTLVYREVTALSALGVAKSDDDERKGKDPWSKTLNWYFFAAANYFLYGENLIYYFKYIVFVDTSFMPFVQNHRIISFTLYTLGFVGFVSSLRKQYVTSQFRMFAWVHMSIMAIVMSSHFIIKNILEGLIWFWVPASLVICNDVFAYVWGITLGRTPLFALSPKKTVEGFVGAAISTVIFGVFWGTFFMQFDYMICPAQTLGINALSEIHCRPNHVFVWQDLRIWAPVRIALSTLLQRNVSTIPYAPYQIHLLVMSVFASLVAPFGGFFASGFKRAFHVKDFGHSIPGHGGMTDRMDCQFLMGMFTWVYYSSLIKEHHVSVGQVMQLVASSLSVDDQIQLFHELQRYLRLEGQGVVA